MSDIEEWRPIAGFESYYDISSLGRVRSLARIVPSPQTAKGYPVKPRILRPGVGPRGHRVFRLRKGTARYFKGARLVLAAFVGPCPDGMEACHNNGHGGDDRLVNLRWDTRSENVLDAVRHGTHQWSKRESCVNGHLFTEQNTYRSPANTQRHCRTCRREVKRAQRRREKQAAAA